MAHFALLWKARTIEKYRQNYENEKYFSIQDTNTPMPQKSLSQRLRCYRQDTQKRFSKIFQKIYPEGSSLSNFFLYLRTDQTCLHFVLKSLLGFLIGLGLTYLCFLFLMFQLSISLFHATIVSSIIGVLLTMGLAFSYRIRCLIFLLLPQFFSRAGRYTLTCYALVLILTGPATNTLKNSEVLSESMACRQEQIKTLVNEVKQTMRKPLNSMRDSIKIMVQKIHQFAKQLKQTLLKVNRLTLTVLETIQSTFSWLQWLSNVCNKIMGSPFQRCIKVLKEGLFDYKRRFEPNIAQIRRLANKAEEICSNVNEYKAICVFTDFVNGSFVASIKRRLKNFSERIKNMLYLQIHVHHSYSFSSNTNHSASQVAAGIVTEIRKRADPLLTWLSWSSCVTSLFLLLIIFRAKYYQHMFETRSRFDNKYITKELRDLDLKRLRHGRETILPLNRRERSKYVSTTSFRLVASEKIHLNRSIVFMAITTFKLLIHMVADYSLYWVLMTIRYHGNNQTPLPFGVPNAGMHITGTGRIADMFKSLLMALTSPLETPQPLSNTCLPDPHPPNLKRYTQIGILIFLLWFFALFEPYGLRLRHVIMGLYRPERAQARAEWLYNHILRTRGGFMKFARRKLHRSYKYCTEEKYTFKRWLTKHIPFCWIRYLLGIPSEEAHCLLCGTKEDSKDPNSKLQKCYTRDCPGVYCCSCFSDIGELCTICLSPRDYGDLSDISLEKGSSDDESHDDSKGNEGGRAVPKNNDESEQVIFEYESDNILLPKPLRDDTQNYTKKSERQSTTYMSNVALSTKFKREVFDKAEDPSKFKQIKIHLYSHFKKKPQSNFVTISKTCWLPYFDWKISVKSRIHVRNKSLKIVQKTVYEDNREIKDNIKKLVDKIEDTKEKFNNINSYQEKHTKNNEGGNEQKQSRHTTNPPLTKDRGENKHGKGNDSDEYEQKNIDKYEKNYNDNHIGQDEMTTNELEFTPCCCFKQFNTVFCSYWNTMKDNLFNRCSLLAQVVINNTLGPETKNFKTRKKESSEIRDSNETENENTRDSRQYRIFTYLAEQEWIIKKTFQYENTEEEFSLLNEGVDIKTTEDLKQDLYSQTVHYKEVSFAKCTTSSSQAQGFKPNQNIRNEPTQLKPYTKQHVLICEDCKYNCCCPGNPINQFNDVPRINTRTKKTNDSGIIITQLETDCSCDNNPKKTGYGQKILYCLKSMFSSKQKKMTLSEDPCPCAVVDSKIKANPVCKLNFTTIEDIQSPLIDQAVQFRECDCAVQNRAIQVKERKKAQHHIDHGPNIPKKTLFIDGDYIGQSNKLIKCECVSDSDDSANIEKLGSLQCGQHVCCDWSKKRNKCCSLENDRPKRTEICDPSYHDQTKQIKKSVSSQYDLPKKIEKIDPLHHTQSNKKGKYDHSYSNKSKKKEKLDQSIKIGKRDSLTHGQPKKKKRSVTLCDDKSKKKEKYDPTTNAHSNKIKKRDHSSSNNLNKVEIKSSDVLCCDLPIMEEQHESSNSDNLNQVTIENSDSKHRWTKKPDFLYNNQSKKIPKFDSLCFGESSEIQQCNYSCSDSSNKVGICDPLCPSECQCKGYGYKKEKCDPLCPEECLCGGHGVQFEKCDALCPKECCCNKYYSLDDNQCRSSSNSQKQYSDSSYNIGKCDYAQYENENARQLAQHHMKLLNSAYKKRKNVVEIKHTDNRLIKAKAKKKSHVEIQCQCSESSLDFSLDTNKSEANMCSCAVQYVPPKQSEESEESGCYRSGNSSSSYTVSIISDDRTIRSDFTGTDNIIRFAYLDMPRIKRPRYIRVIKRNQCTGTEPAVKYNIGTITNKKGLVRKNRFYLTENNNGGFRVVKQRTTENRGVSTKKIVSFRSEVQFIPSYSYGSSLDTYTPLRYLVESQKYYNELFTMNSNIPNVYLFKTIKNRSHKHTSSLGSRSSRKGLFQSKRLENYTYLKPKKTSLRKSYNSNNGAKYRKITRKKYRM